MRIVFGKEREREYILVVGKNPATRGPLVQCVRELERDVLTAASVHEAAEHIAQQGRKIKSALIEVADKDCFGLLRRFLTDKMPVLAVSPYSAPEAVSLLTKVGARNVVTLPANKAQLGSAIASLIEA